MGLDFVLMRNAGTWNESTDRHLKGGLSMTGWAALFFKVLGCPEAEPFVEGEDINEYDERYRQRFREAILDYPMLGRITDYYDDVWYEPEEVVQLRDECVSVQSNTKDQDALRDLDELLRACDEAQRHNLGLFLAAD